MISCRAPGKLFVAGEYAVVEPGHRAVLVAVDRYATATVTATDGDTVLASDLEGGSSLRCSRVTGDQAGVAASAESAPTNSATAALAAEAVVPRAPASAGHPGSFVSATGSVPATFSYLFAAASVLDRLVLERGITPRPYRLDVTADLGDADGRKFGLGSSAAVTVAAVTALGEFYELGLSSMDRYRLAMLATVTVHPRASGGDVAASTWGGWLAYSSPDRARVAEAAEADGVDAALRLPWPGLSVRPLPTPTTLELHIGWTGIPASTPALVAGLGAPLDRAEFLVRSDACVERLAAAVDADDPVAIRTEIDCARELLLGLDAAERLGVMTERLAALCHVAAEVGAAAKPSGAGGGDCGIALLEHGRADAVAALTDGWEAAGIRKLPLRIHPSEGVRA
ncbi:phosphomevalonate kinase [Nocardia coubleae]|uniref:Phosphomevalonate kinase n=1 Tax=Nocardia coubleae TaxID=356147 RepID=A0A846WBP7_9NOCA|nr:phosphomevalonate kinase [Nocardia coubleae]NKX89977.1 phosphomevalonate kinase [Nocardia coubleae]